MSLDIAAGETWTTAAGSDTYAGPVNNDGTLNVDGELYMTASTAQAAAGSGSATGTATATPTRASAAAGIGSGFGNRAVIIADGEVRTVAAGETLTAGPLYLDGTLHLDGVTYITEALTQSTRVRSTLADGVGEGVGDAESRPERRTLAAGTGDGLGAADAIIFRALRRSTSVGIDNSRRDEFDTQGIGEVPADD